MSNNGVGTTICITIGILLFIGWIIGLSEPKCAMYDCDNKSIDGSRYCVLHDMSYKAYGNPDYHAVYKNSQQNRETNNNTSSGINDRAETSSSGAGTKAGTGTTSTNETHNSKSYTENTYDPYDVYEYDDPDDFADEWAEEFGDDDYDEGYDEAYDYWEDEMDF